MEEKRKKHRKSILQLKEDRRCYLCALEGNLQEQSYLEEHHVMFGEGLRQLSEEYGLKVNLCTRHHRTGKEAVHNNKENADKLKKNRTGTLRRSVSGSRLDGNIQKKL